MNPHIKIAIANSALAGCFFSACTHANCVPSAYQQIAAEYELPADVFYAVSLAESGQKTEEYGFAVWPWALNIDEQSYYPDSKEQAVQLITDSLDNGNQKIAVGLMQVYWRFHHDIFANNPRFALDVGANLRAGAKILKDFVDQASDVWTGVGYYYAGRSQSAEAV